MERRFPWVPLALIGLLLLAPGPVSRFLLNVLGGLTLTILILPLLLVGGGLIAWRLLLNRVQTCPACGISTIAAEVCPACGSSLASTAEPEPSAGGAVAGGRYSTWSYQSSVFDFVKCGLQDEWDPLPTQDPDAQACDVTIDVQARAVSDDPSA